ncbi:acyltransferase [Geodermatophilus sp. SYSU D00758]
MAVHGILVNRVAASVAVPRVLRYLVYRLVGMDLRTPNVFPGVEFAGTRVRLGSGTFVNGGVRFEDVAPITVGEDCQIGMDVLFVTSHHETTGDSVARTPTPRPITVGDRCWIGARAVLLPGVTVADDCVVAAGAVVSRDCPTPGVYAGNPARRIRDRRGT